MPRKAIVTAFSSRDPELLRAAKKRAAAEEISLSQLICRLLRQELARAGRPARGEPDEEFESYARRIARRVSERAEEHARERGKRARDED